MKSPKTPYLYELLTAFSHDEIQHLRASLQRIDRNGDCLRLLDIIITTVVPALKQTKPVRIHDSDVGKLCDAANAWDDKKVTAIRHKIMKALLSILANGRQEDDTPLFQLAVLARLLSYRAIITYEHVAKPLRKWIDDHLLSSGSYWPKLKLAELDLEFALLTTSRNKPIDFEPTVKALESFYVFHWLKWQSLSTYKSKLLGVSPITSDPMVSFVTIKLLSQQDALIKRALDCFTTIAEAARVDHLDMQNWIIIDFSIQQGRAVAEHSHLGDVKAANLLLVEGTDLFERRLFVEERKVLAEHHHKTLDGNGNLVAVIEALDRYFIFNFLKLQCAIANQARILDLDHNPPQLTFSNPRLRQLQEQSPLVGILFSIFHLVSDESTDKTYFQKAEEMLNLTGHLIDPDERADCYTQLINIAARALASGEMAFASDLRRLYVNGIQNNHLLDKNGKLSPYHFKNMLNTACRDEDFDWVKEIHQTYLPLVQPSFVELMDSYAIGLIAFSELNFAKAIISFHRALQLLDLRPNGDPFIELDSRLFLVKSLFEARKPFELETELTSLRMLARRTKKVAKRHSSQFDQFCKILSRISSTDKPRRWKLERERRDLLEKSLVTERLWLLKKIDQLIQQTYP